MVAAGATAMVVDGFLLDPRRIAITEKTVPIHSLPEAFEDSGYVINRYPSRVLCKY